MRILILPLALLWFSGCATVRCPHEGGDPWREVTSAHFVLQTNLSSEAAKATAEHFEKYRRALLLAFSEDFDPAGKLRVIVPRSEAEFHAFSPDIGGYFMAGSTDALIVVPGQSFSLDSGAVPEVVAHELAHYLTRQVFTRQPRWFAEGLATYLQSTYVRANGVEVEIGRPDRGYVAWLQRNGRSAPERLWEWDSTALSSDEVTRVYATSFLWTHFLMNEHSARFTSFQERLSRGEEPSAAWAKSFEGLSADQLLTEVNTFARLGRYRVSVFKLPPIDTTTTERALTDADVHAIRAQLAMGPGPRSAAERMALIRKEMDAALAFDPHHIGAHEVALSLGVSAEELVKRGRVLVENKPTDGRSHYLLSLGLRSPEQADERLSALEAAVFHSPNDPEILNAIAWEYAMRGEGENALPFASKAAKLVPWSSAVVDTYAAASAAAGKCVQARTLQRRAIDLLPDSASEETRQDYRSRLQQYASRCGS